MQTTETRASVKGSQLQNSAGTHPVPCKMHMHGRCAESATQKLQFLWCWPLGQDMSTMVPLSWAFRVLHTPTAAVTGYVIIALLRRCSFHVCKGLPAASLLLGTFLCRSTVMSANAAPMTFSTLFKMAASSASVKSSGPQPPGPPIVISASPVLVTCIRSHHQSHLQQVPLHIMAVMCDRCEFAKTRWQTCVNRCMSLNVFADLSWACCNNNTYTGHVNVCGGMQCLLSRTAHISLQDLQSMLHPHVVFLFK